MILLDTDHVTILRFSNSSRSQQLLSKLELSTDEVAIPIIAIEETMRGWISAIAKERQAVRQIFAYRELGDLFAFFSRFQIVPFEISAAQQFDKFSRIRIGATDRKNCSHRFGHQFIVAHCECPRFWPNTWTEIRKLAGVIPSCNNHSPFITMDSVPSGMITIQARCSR